LLSPSWNFGGRCLVLNCCNWLVIHLCGDDKQLVQLALHEAVEIDLPSCMSEAYSCRAARLDLGSECTLRAEHPSGSLGSDGGTGPSNYRGRWVIH
jgi:hypothetical protein